MSTKKVAKKVAKKATSAKAEAPVETPAPAKKAAAKKVAKEVAAVDPKKEAEAQKQAAIAAALKVKLDEQKAKEQAKEDERGGKLELARMKGVEIGEAYKNNAVAGIQHIVGKNFVVDATGLQVAEGNPTIKESDLVSAMSGLATAGSNLDNVKASVIWSTGDLVNLMETLPRGEELIEQAIAVSGKDKHTVQQARRLAAWIPHDKRIAALTATHHMEAFNYSKVNDEDGKRILTDARLFKFLADAEKGEKVVSRNKVTGEEVEMWKPISCAELRKRLQDACGITKKVKEEKEEPEDTEESEDTPETKNGYLYTSPEGIPFWSESLSINHISAGFTCVDLVSMMTISEDGEEVARVENLTEAPLEDADTEDAGGLDLPE